MKRLLLPRGCIVRNLLRLLLASLLFANAAFATDFPVNAPPVTAYRNLDLGVTGQVVCSYPCSISSYYIANNASAARFVKFYNKATAATESDTPVLTFEIPANGGANLALLNQGWQFTTGLSIRGTTGVADSDTGAPSTNDIVINLGTERYISAP